MLPRTLRGRAGASGFSLVEILAVLVILGILAALAAPVFSGMTARASTRAALDRITADVAYARMLAVREGRPAAVTFEADRYRVVVDPGGVNRTAKTVELPREYPGLQVTAPAGNQIRFNSRGFLQPAGSVRIKASRSGAVDSVTISPLGQVQRAY
jgi:type II secretion system protein H